MRGLARKEECRHKARIEPEKPGLAYHSTNHHRAGAGNERKHQTAPAGISDYPSVNQHYRDTQKNRRVDQPCQQVTLKIPHHREGSNAQDRTDT